MTEYGYYGPTYIPSICIGIEAVGVLFILIAGVSMRSSVRRQQDPARNVVIWLRISFAALLMGYCLTMANLFAQAFEDYGTGIVAGDGLLPARGWPYGSTSGLRAITRVGLVGQLFLYSGAAAMLVGIMEAVSGVSLLVTDAKRIGHQELVYFLSLVAVVLQLATCIMGQIYYTGVFFGERGLSSDHSDGGGIGKRYGDPLTDGLDRATAAKGRTASMLQGVTLAVLLFGSFVVLLGALKVNGKAGKEKTLKSSMEAITVVAWMLFVVRLWSIAAIVFIFSPDTALTVSPRVYLITDAMIDKVGTAICFLLLFGVAAKGEGGLWSLARAEALQGNHIES